MKHQFFQGFNTQQGAANIGQNLTPTLIHNLMVMELYNNWENVIDLILRTEKQDQIQVDLIERDWIGFINKNKIDIKSYSTNEDFIEKHLKLLVKEDLKPLPKDK